ncbi:MAG: PQQ-binding-like beta-propeller repeat protein [Thermoanaerobaculia bacterium]
MKKFLLVVLLGVLGVLSAGWMAIASAESPDPIEGKWYGEAGFPQDRIEVGLEFKRNEKGELKAFLYEPVGNFYGLELPGIVGRKGETYTIDSYATTLTLHGDALEGTYLPTNAPASLHRTEKLPSEVPVPALPPGPGPKWRAKLGAGAIYAPAAVRDGIAYVGSTNGAFNAIRERDGAFVWIFAAGRPIFGGALATDGHVFFVCDNGYLYKLDRKTGKEVWRYDLGDARSPRILSHQIIDTVEPTIGDFDFENSSPLPRLADGVLFVGSGDGSFHAVDAETGKRVWRFEAPENGKPPESTPWNPEGSNKIRTDALIDGPRVVFGSFGHKLRALDRKSGAEIWQKDLRAEISSSPALVDGKIVVGSRGGALYAFEPETGKKLWAMIFWGSAIESTAAPGGGSLFYIGASDLRRVSLIDAKDTRVLWRTDVFGLPWPRPAVWGGRVFASAIGYAPYQMRHLGSFTALDTATGRIVWRWPAPVTDSLVSGFAAPPVVDGDLVIVGGLDGDLYGFPVE